MSSLYRVHCESSSDERPKSTNLIGIAQSSSKLQLADLMSYIYISRLNKSTTIENVKEFLKEKGEDCTKIELLTQRYETDFCSFKIAVQRNKLDTFLSKDFWPKGIKFRLYHERKTRSVIQI